MGWRISLMFIFTNPFKCYLSVFVFCSFTPFPSVSFVLHRKNLFNLNCRKVSSAGDQFLKNRYCTPAVQSTFMKLCSYSLYVTQIVALST